MSVGLFAQQVVHVVGRGDTFASIASKYQTTVEALQKANPYLKNLYVGMEVTVPHAQTPVPGTSKPISSPNGYVSEEISRPALAYIGFAENYMKENKHNKAIKELNKSLEIQETLKARWLRGKCYYYEEKWKKALDDLAYVKKHKLVDNDIREQAENMYNLANNQYELKRAERAEFWTKVGAGALMTAAVVGTAALANEQAKSSSSYSSSSVSDVPTSTVGSSYQPLDLQKVWHNAAVRTEVEIQNEFNNFRQLQLMTTGVEPTWEDFWRAKAEVANSTATTTYGMDVSSTTSSGTDTNARMGQIHQDAYRKQESVVEGHYRTLTSGGYRGENNSGNIIGAVSKSTANSPGTHAVTRNAFYQSQKRLKEIRMEASRAGVVITPSRWETATVN